MAFPINKRTNVQRGRMSREKGKRGEREVKNIFQFWFKEHGIDDIEARRVLTESREGSFDVEIGPPGDASERLPWAIQVKNVSSQYGGFMLKGFREALHWDTEYEPVGVVKIPAAHNKAKRDLWIATITLDHFVDLFCKAHQWDKGHTRKEHEERN